MTGLLDDGRVTAVAARDGRDHLEPFNSIFAARCAPLMEASLARGERSVARFLRGCDGVKFISEETARRFSPDGSMFASINTRADVDRFLAGERVALPYLRASMATASMSVKVWFSPAMAHTNE